MAAANQRRGPWSNAEDAVLMNLVSSQGALNWVRISQHLGTRTPKQCRERYHQNLKPSLNHDPITPEEGQQIERLVHEIGKRWAEIARRLHGRSDNAVKNWWNGSQNRRKRQDRRRASHGSAQHQPQPQPQQQQQQRYEERPEMHYHRQVPPALAIPRPVGQLPLPSSRPIPRPLSPSRFNQHAYPVETPLPSPPALSPEAESEMAPSLLSDSGSCYTTSPRSTTLTYSPIELPPLKNQGSASPRYATSPTETRLPGFASLTHPYMGKEDMSRSLAPVMAHQEHMSPRSHLPTAPNSPVGPRGLPALRTSLPRDYGHFDGGFERQGRRMDVAALLG